jgi:hypothetical protein
MCRAGKFDDHLRRVLSKLKYSISIYKLENKQQKPNSKELSNKCT